MKLECYFFVLFLNEKWNNGADNFSYTSEWVDEAIDF